ncbi:MAG: response regulator [Anaerolineales bacterium]|nr:response regulator [Anaerolineales bacterium]
MNRQRRILAIDDDPLTLRIVERVLQKHGYEVHTAPNGHEGLAKAQALKPDLVILDIMMPGLDGFQVCRKLREDPETAVITVLMLTARGAIDKPASDPVDFAQRVRDQLKGYRVGASDFLTKPVKAAMLVERVQSLIWSGGSPD